MSWPDRLVVLATLAVATLAVEPFALRDLGGRIGLLAPGEDFARHFLLFDMIGRIGGYAFLHPHEASAYMPAPLAAGIGNYPQGTHLTYALLDRFLRSANTNADGVTGINIMIWLHVATFVFLALAVLWALRRVAGPGPGAVALLPVLGGAAVYLYFGDPVTIMARGFPNELVGLALVAVLTAVVVRPLTSTGEQILTVALLLVGVSFSYHLFLPYAALVAAAWAWRDRRVLLLRRRALAAGLLLMPFTLVTPLTIRAAASGNQLLAPGTALVNDRPVTVTLVALVAVGLTVRAGLRSPARRMAAVALAVAVGEVGALAAFQYATVGHTVYYFEKTVHMLVVVSVVGLGTLARLVPATPVRPAGYLRLAALTVVPALVLVGAGGPTHTTPGSYGLRLALGVEKGSPQGGRDAILMTRRYPDAGGKVNVSLMHTPFANLFATYFGSTMQRDYRHGHAWYVFLYPTQPRTEADLERLVLDSDVPVRFFLSDPSAPHAAAAQSLARRHPDRVEIVHVPPGATQ